MFIFLNTDYHECPKLFLGVVFLVGIKKEKGIVFHNTAFLLMILRFIDLLLSNVLLKLTFNIYPSKI